MKKVDIPPLQLHTFEVNGKERTYLSNETPESPSFILIVFHGNGGTADGFAKKYAIHSLMPDGLIIYLQGIPGIGGGFDPKGLKNGWQRKKGDGEDRDLNAIDVLVNDLINKYPSLKNNVFAMGHSNGGRFTYLLWSERASLFKGFIINAHQGIDLIEAGIHPKSGMIITGRQDKVVNNVNQLKSAELIKALLKCDQSEVINDELTKYSSSKNDYTLYHYIHLGGHDLAKPALKYVAEFLGQES